MSRYTDVRREHQTGAPEVPLRPIDFGKVRANGPKVLSPPGGESTRLPRVDAVAISWTTAEWSAMDHVFINHASARSPHDHAWEGQWTSWHDQRPSSPLHRLKEIGQYRVVELYAQDGGSLKVLAFKSNVHLAHEPYLAGLNAMVDLMLEQASPRLVMSTGTAGGDTMSDRLGDVIITDGGYLDMSKPENLHTGSGYNQQVFTCTTWFPQNEVLLANTAELLGFPLRLVCTPERLSSMIAGLKGLPDRLRRLDTFENAVINPRDLNQPSFKLKRGVPLKTTDTYYIASGPTSDNRYAVLEMDDAAIGHEILAQKGPAFLFCRNVSDPLVAWQSPSGDPIPTEARGAFSSDVYQEFGLYTAYNGALAAWALLASNALP